jgi:outer membrane protein OmpA-like peptidoglycan-associated protein/tetratricopeptide (TPR) repeat protein
MRWKLLLVLCIIVRTVLPVCAQLSNCPVSEVKKAQAAFDDASGLFKSRKYEDALNEIERAIDADPEFADAYFMQGTIAQKRKEFKLMEESFLKAIELCPEVDPEPYYQLGWLYFDRKNWQEAENYLKKFLDFDKINEEHGTRAEMMLTRAKLYAHPVPFSPVPVKALSTPDPEYLPYISPDKELAFFTRRFEMKDKNMLVPQSVEKFMMARLQTDGTYDRGEAMEAPFNRGMSNNEGGATITIDNKHLFFTVNNKGNFDLFTADKTDGYWGELKNLGAVNDARQWDSQPSITSDGQLLYFASARDSVSGLDIYFSRKQEDGAWSKAVKLGPSVNTNGNEKSPFIHGDNKTLYFASDSLPGLGGFDLFVIRKDDQGKWGKPINLGYPINTDADEVSFFVSTDGKTGYFASNKVNGNSGYDIYSFELYPEARPSKVYFQKGDLKVGQDEMVPATIEVRDVVTNKLTRIDIDSLTGEYAFMVNFDHDLMLSVKKEGFAFQSQYVSQKDTANVSLQRKEIQLSQLEVGGQYTINDILFASNSDQLNDTIKVVLNEFAEYLVLNPTMKLSLQGHTDDIGSPESNMLLSESRAKTVSDYLLSRGIDKSRLTYQGFGETRPIASNATEEGRAKNRRTVFVVTQK